MSKVGAWTGRLAYFCWLLLDAHWSTKMRILSIFAGKSKTMENQQNQSKSTQNQSKSKSKSTTFICFAHRGGWRCQQPKWRVPPTTLGRVFSYTILYKLWTHRGVTMPLLHFYIVDPTGTVMTRDSANSQTCRKWGNVWNLVKLHTLVEISEFCILLYVYDRVIFSKMQHLPSFEFFTSSKICTATCPW